ncbi:MAG: BamA/TamA family outer membrane protein [Pseudomonadota bacterium]
MSGSSSLQRRIVVAYLLLARCLPVLLLAFTASLVPARADQADQQNAVPSFAELQDAGAVVGEIRINTQNIFDLDDPKENKALFRLANKLHIRTRPGVIQRMLLFKSGEPVSVRLIEETERLLRSNRNLYDVSIRPVAHHDGVVDIEIKTRDTWSLDPGISLGRAGGVNSGGIALEEKNLLGTGTSLGLSRTSDVDRSSTEFQISQNHAFGGWTSIAYSYATNDDGGHQSFNLARPFYALDTRWAAGLSLSKDNRIDSVYNSGVVAYQYRHRQDAAETYGGWSEGLIDGWTRRYSIGLTYQDDTYEIEPDLAPPPELPSDQTLVAPFFRYEVIEDGYRKFKNRDQIERPEYFEMGFQSSVQLGRSLTALGSSREAWLYSGRVSNGFELQSNHTLLTSASLSGQYGNGKGEHQLYSGSARYYAPHSKRALFFAGVSGDIVRNPDISDLLQLGGDNGLRGYPLRYQSGDRRVLLTLEERLYTDWYPFRLFRVGGAVFFDVGRAWGGENQNTANPGWLSDVGFGLRILVARSAFGNVLHADVAFPLNGDPSIESVQFLFRTKASF